MEEDETLDTSMSQLPSKTPDTKGASQSASKPIKSIEKSYSCDDCRKTWKKKDGLRTHLKKCPFKMSERLEQFIKATNENPDIKYGIKKELPRETHQCEICEKCFATKCSLKAHGKIHSNEKPYSCDTCGKKFRHESSLKYHWKTCKYRLSERLSEFISYNSKQSITENLSPLAQKVKYILPPVTANSKDNIDQGLNTQEANFTPSNGLMLPELVLYQDTTMKEEVGEMQFKEEITVKQEITEVEVKEEVIEMEDIDIIVKTEI